MNILTEELIRNEAWRQASSYHVNRYFWYRILIAIWMFLTCFPVIVLVLVPNPYFGSNMTQLWAWLISLAILIVLNIPTIIAMITIDKKQEKEVNDEYLKIVEHLKNAIEAIEP